MLKKVKLYGELAERYGKDWSLDINSPKEAVRALIANNPDFAQFVGTSQDRGVGYKISVGGTYLDDPVNEIYNPSGRQEIKIIPVILGAKNKDGWKKIIIGALLIWGGGALVAAAEGAALAAATAGSGYAGATAVSAGGVAAGLAGTAAVKIGHAMVLGGVGMLLTPTPKDVEETNNYAFNGAINTVRQGVPVPICYGQLLVGSSVISSGISEGAY
jgi:predicted phage tail protein